ncbi:MAG: glycosyltransferase family 1 protein [Bernardetiaceae bacterium]|nr:glycosyltransferase family 1 protein [Bernardetiaceae bacterium]
MLKIFFHVTSQQGHKLFHAKYFKPQASHQEAISEILSVGSTALMGACKEKLGKKHFVTFANSAYLQQLWAKEQKLSYDNKNWEIQILNAQIEYFQPDVIYTVNPEWFSQNYKKIADVKIKAAWKASPFAKGLDFSCFDVGLSFNETYLKQLDDAGVKRVVQQDFCFDPNIKPTLFSSQNKDIDLSFTGTYNDFMFQKRNTLLHKIIQQFYLKKKIRYYLKTYHRVKGLVPILPKSFYLVYRKSVFFKDFLNVINRSKIVFNCHSDSTGARKGNMRVFEALGMGAFMLSDIGEYPPYIKEGRDFIAYKDQNDLIDKVQYFLKHEKERQEIAQTGYETIKKYHNVTETAKKLEQIFIG